MISKKDMAVRLVEERTRLGYTQANFAHQAGKTREILRKYEHGETMVSTDFLVHVAQLGVDVQYVLTGVRSSNMETVAKAVIPSENAPVNQVSGNVTNSVLAGAGAVVNQINTQRHITRTKAIVKPGEEHVTDEEKADLTRLVNEIVSLEAQYRSAGSAKSHRAVWSALNKHCKVTSYHLIPLEKYEMALRFLRRWIGRLNSMSSAPKKGKKDWRNRRCWLPGKRTWLLPASQPSATNNSTKPIGRLPLKSVGSCETVKWFPRSSEIPLPCFFLLMFAKCF